MSFFRFHFVLLGGKCLALVVNCDFNCVMVENNLIKHENTKCDCEAVMNCYAWPCGVM